MRGLVAAVILALATSAPALAYDVREKPIATLQADMTDGRASSQALVRAYQARIRALDPKLNSIIALNPNALAEARALDEERKTKGSRGPLHGIPVLLKDNIDTKDPVATTAGSLALTGNFAAADAALAGRLRAAGAVILGKTNLSEWANIRSNYSVSGWSAVGGQTRNPYVLDRNACGSSSGTGAAIAASFAAVGVGSETNGSIVCPSSVSGLVGVKPTVGLVSRTGMVPISESQDTAGPMARTVRDAAVLLAAMAGSDPKDAATREADARRVDYLAGLSPDALKGKRLGVFEGEGGYSPGVDSAFEKAKATLIALGAEIVTIPRIDQRRMSEAQELILKVEFKAGLKAYLATAPDTVKITSLADAIAFNAATPAELAVFGQDFFVEAEKSPGLDDATYLAARADAKRLAGPEGIDKVMADNRLDALIGPSGGPAWTTDLVNGDHFLGSFSNLAAIAGYPHVTLPMGDVHGLPVGLSFVGGAWSEAKLLGFAYAFEQRTQARRAPTFAPTIEALDAGLAKATRSGARN